MDTIAYFSLSLGKQLCTQFEVVSKLVKREQLFRPLKRVKTLKQGTQTNYIYKYITIDNYVLYCLFVYIDNLYYILLLCII